MLSAPAEIFEYLHCGIWGMAIHRHHSEVYASYITDPIAELFISYCQIEVSIKSQLLVSEFLNVAGMAGSARANLFMICAKF